LRARRRIPIKANLVPVFQLCHALSVRSGVRA
jgi:hypothetical protein